MQLTINGKNKIFPQQLTVEQLLAQLHLSPTQVVIELNHDIVFIADHSQTELKTGDQVEIVHFVGGG